MDVSVASRRPIRSWRADVPLAMRARTSRWNVPAANAARIDRKHRHGFVQAVIRFSIPECRRRVPASAGLRFAGPWFPPV